MNIYQIASIIQYKRHKRVKPSTIQMPITSRCNSRCKTCNVWKYKDNKDIDPIALEKALNDPFFSEVTVVGLNGGEFTLVPNFIEILKAVLTLPKIRYIALISNGLLPSKLFAYLEQVKEICTVRNVKFNICISVDGFGERHEFVRGVPNCFSRTKEILDCLAQNPQKYCDSYSVGCTLSKHNIEYIREAEAFFDSYKGLSVEYHLAVPNKRIKTFDDYEGYYVLTDERFRMLCSEFFYEQFKKTEAIAKKKQYYINYYFLTHNGTGRLCTCSYTNQDVTIDENLDLSLCATASDIIGNLKDFTASELINSPKTKEILKTIVSRCDHCVHYSYNSLTVKGRFCFINEMIKSRYALEYYEAFNHQKLKLRIGHLWSLSKRVLHDYLVYFYVYVWKLQ